MSLRKWYTARGLRFICKRGTKLLNRYGILPAMAIRRLNECVEALVVLGCAPTFPTPGNIVQRYPQFIRSLEDRGAEIAVHSYEHVDLGHFRCPWPDSNSKEPFGALSALGSKLAASAARIWVGAKNCETHYRPECLTTAATRRSASRQTTWMSAPKTNSLKAVRRFYRGRLFSENLCVPATRPNMIEIPVCVPDDLQLRDGMGLEPEGIGQVWGKMLGQIYERGELFTLMFHPELASVCKSTVCVAVGRGRPVSPSGVDYQAARGQRLVARESWLHSRGCCSPNGSPPHFHLFPARHNPGARPGALRIRTGVGWNVHPAAIEDAGRAGRSPPICRPARLRAGASRIFPARAGLHCGHDRRSGPLRHLPGCRHAGRLEPGAARRPHRSFSRPPGQVLALAQWGQERAVHHRGPGCPDAV